MIKIDWKEVFVTLNGTTVRKPKTVKVPLRDKYRLRTLMASKYSSAVGVSGLAKILLPLLHVFV